MIDVWSWGCIAWLALLAGAIMIGGCLPGRPSGGDLRDERIGYIDGLRGCLALSVVAHHFSIAVNASRTGFWKPPPNNVLANIGPAAVILFFLITGVLFYGRAVARDGRVSHIRFFMGRTTRLLPAFMVAVAAAVAAALLCGTPRVPETRLHQALSLANWMSFTMVGGSTTLAGIDLRQDLSVVWTLRYEWGFYLVFPAICALLRIVPTSRATRIGCLVVLIAISPLFYGFRVHGLSASIASCFLWGMLAVELAGVPRVRRLFSGRLIGILGLLGLMTELVLSAEPYGFRQYLLIFLFFMAVLVGNPVYAILASRNAVRVGDASYSIYLLHLLIIHLLFSTVPRAVDANSPTVWFAMIVAGLIIVFVASCTYVLVEHPFIVLGRSDALLQVASRYSAALSRRFGAMRRRVFGTRQPHVSSDSPADLPAHGEEPSPGTRLRPRPLAR